MNYNKLWKILIDKNLNKTDLMKLAGVSSATMAKLSKKQMVGMDTLVRICTVLNCDIADVCSIERKQIVSTIELQEV